MSIPTDPKEQAIYHMILSDLHRVQASLLNLRSLEDPDTAQSLREHFSREQTIAFSRLTEWKQRRPQIYEEARRDFEGQVQQAEP